MTDQLHLDLSRIWTIFLQSSTCISAFLSIESVADWGIMKIAVLVIALTSISLITYAQTIHSARVQLRNSSLSSEMSVAPYSEAHSEPFDEAFERHGLTALKPYSFVLSNHTKRCIAGLTLLWIATDANGKQQRTEFSSDSFFMTRDPIGHAGERILITPSFLLPEALAKSGYISGGPSGQDIVKAFDSSTSVTLQVDTVILDDGQVLGPDETKTVEKISARREAALDIADGVRASLIGNRDIQQTIDDFTHLPRSSASDYRGMWRIRLAHMLKHSQDPAGVINQFAALPLPKFHR